MNHYYLVEKERLEAGLSINGHVRPVKKAIGEEVTWEHVKGPNGQIVRVENGILMVNNHGDYAIDTYHYLIDITDHELQQARLRHELREFINW